MPAGDEQTVDTRAAALEREQTVHDWLADQFIRQDERDDDADEEEVTE